MIEQKINEDFLLLLTKKCGQFEKTTINIDNQFESELLILKELCAGNVDNFNQIIQYLENTLKPKLPNKIFNYCKELDKAEQRVIVNIEIVIKDIISKRDLIYLNEKTAKEIEKHFNLSEEIERLKKQILEKSLLWFKVFNIELTYNIAKNQPNVLVYSHRISGWSSPENKITENLKQQIKTNFGYGSVSYFYSLLTFKNIQITPFSDWIDYRYANFEEVVRYTKKFNHKIPVLDKNNKIKYFSNKIENKDWNAAIEFTKNAANLLLSNEQEFVKKYIIDQCDQMIDGLQNIYKETKFNFIDERNETIKYTMDYTGYELIEFRTEKIIGALNFITRINEYSIITPVKKYADSIIAINNNFIPKVYVEVNNQNNALKTEELIYADLITKHNELIEKQKFYQNEKLKLKNGFEMFHKNEYSELIDSLIKSNECLKQVDNNIKKINTNINKLTIYIKKYIEIISE